MEEFRYKVVWTDGSHYFYSPRDFQTTRQAFYSAFWRAREEDVKEVQFYIGSKLVATFYH